MLHPLSDRISHDKQARKRLAEHEAEMGDLRSEFQEFLQADEGKLTQMARLLASIQDLQQQRDSLSSQLTEAQTSSEVAQPMSRSLALDQLMHPSLKHSRNS